MRVVRPFLPATLVGEAAWHRLEEVTRYFRADVLAALEFRLAESEERVDFSLRVDQPFQAREAAQLGISNRLQAFLLRWSESPATREQIPALWLELDLSPETPGIPEPLVCLQIAPALDLEILTDDLLPALRGEPLDPKQRDALQACRSEALASGRLLYVFDLQARQNRAIRLEILGRSTAESLGDFERLTGTPPFPSLVTAASLLETVERPHLSFDVENEILPRVGLEGSFRRVPHSEPRWAELFDRLVSAGLCTAEKREALFTWPGYDTPRSAVGRWPAEVSRGWCVRSLSHVKLVAKPEQPLEAKAYLTFQYLLERSARKR